MDPLGIRHTDSIPLYSSEYGPHGDCHFTDLGRTGITRIESRLLPLASYSLVDNST